ncbi:Cell division protein FtsL [Gammaproteobacteria bacterium]
MDRHVWGWFLLVAAVFGSAMGVVYTRHISRQLYSELRHLQVVRDNLQVEWGKLELEESTWATHPRVERIANSRLDMQLPSQEQLVVITPR